MMASNRISVAKAVAIILLCLPNAIISYRILGLFPHPGLSHFHYFHPIMRTLAQKGHQIDVLSIFPDKNPVANYTDYSITGLEIFQDIVDLEIFAKMSFWTQFAEFFLLTNFGYAACEATLNSKDLDKILKKKYDLIVMEIFNSDCVYSISHLLKAPVVGLSSCALMPWHYSRLGQPHIPSYMPITFLDNSEDMNFFNRVGNLFNFHAFNFMYGYINQPGITNLVRKRFGPDFPHVKDLTYDISMVLVNQHYSLSGSKPLSPTVVDIGGVHIQEFNPLPKDIQELLDGAKNGVIFVSWGSMIRANTLPSEMREALLKVFGKLKQTILWKFENETLANRPSNVIIRKWMPQKEILCHPNVKVFMSHGGLLGSSEAAYCGVPTIVTPIYGDQYLNGKALTHRGMAKILYYYDLNEKAIEEAIRFALEPRTKENAKKVSFSFKNRPAEALETAVWWIEHVADTNGAPLLKSVSVNLPWYAYYSLDVYIFLAICLTIWAAGWFYLIKFLCRRKKTIRNIENKKSK